METLLQKAQRLGIKPVGAPIAPPTAMASNMPALSGGSETLAQKAQRLGIQPANPPAPAPFKYDVAETQQLKIQRLQAEAEQSRQAAEKANSFTEKYVRPVADSLMPGVSSLGDTIGGIINTNKDVGNYSNTIQSISDTNLNLQKQISQMDKQGKDTTHLKQLYNAGVESLSRLQNDQKDATAGGQKSTGQVGGELALTGLNLLTAGTYGKAAAGMKTGELALPAIFGGAKAALPSTIENARNIAQGVTGLFTKQGAKNVLTGAAKALPVGYAYDTALGAAGMRGEDRTGAKAFIPGAATAISGVLGGTVPALAESVQSIKNVGKEFTKSNAINELEQTYSNLMSGTTPGMKKISKIETKTDMLNNAGTEGKTPMRTLAEDGIIPERSGPKLDTFDQANQYREKITPLRDANRQALTETGLSTAPLKLDDLEAKAIAYAKTPQNINGGLFDKMKKDIMDEFNLLRTHYPSGEIPLGVVDDIKSARWDNVFKNKGLVEADILKKNSEYSIAKSLQKSIEETAASAGNKEVAQLNREIGDRLEAAKFLEDLNGKTIKGGRLLKYITTAIGSSLGQTLPGKIVGALGGNLVGELMIANNIATPIKRFLLRNLESRDPAAFTKTVEWLRTQNLDRETRLLLPAPKPLGSVENPIITPAPVAPTTFEAPAQQIRNESQNIKNPVKLNVQSSGLGNVIPVNKGKGNYYGQTMGEIQTGTIPKKVDTGLPVIPASKLTAPKVQSKSPKSQQTTAATKSEANIGKSIPKNTQGGYISIGGKNVNIHPDDYGTLKDFTDYVAGDYKPSKEEAYQLELAVGRLAEKLNIDLSKFKTLRGVSNEIGRILETEGKSGVGALLPIAGVTGLGTVLYAKNKNK